MKWQNFNAVFPVDSKELKALTDEGHRLFPTQWIEIDKNEHKRRPGGPQTDF